MSAYSGVLAGEKSLGSHGKVAPNGTAGAIYPQQTLGFSYFRLGRFSAGRAPPFRREMAGRRPACVGDHEISLTLAV